MIAMAALACLLTLVPALVACSGRSAPTVTIVAAVMAAAGGGGKLAAVAAGLVGQAHGAFRDDGRAASE